jgi:hypothetical protein
VIANPAAASHLAELDARFEGHLGAVQLRAAQLRERLSVDAAALREQLAPSPAPARVEAPLLADSPLLVLNEDAPPGPDA